MCSHSDGVNKNLLFGIEAATYAFGMHQTDSASIEALHHLRQDAPAAVPDAQEPMAGI
jgi:hypothetical protein